jgi:Tfp pilus assembly protein PilP
MNDAEPREDLNTRAGQLQRVRDKIDEIEDRHKEELAPYKAVKEQLETFFLDQFNELGVDNFKSKDGATVYKIIDASATVADGEAFRQYVQDHDAFELADIRANKTAVREFVEAKGVQPPGINYSTRFKLGFRRAPAKKSKSETEV